MRIAVDHRFTYRFSEPQARIVQMLRLTPSDSEDQTVVSWLIGVDCDARLKDSVDGYGNVTTMLYAEGPISALDVTVTGEVLTSESNGVVRGAAEPLPPLLYLRSTPRSEAGEALAEFAADAAGEGAPLDRLHRLNAALHARFPDAGDAPDAGLAAAEAFARDAATSRDLAQIFVAAARELGAPARCVSGYRLDAEQQSAPHAWAEAHVDGLGWVGFDPSTGLSPDERYVRVATGLDATAAASVAGTRIGQGEEMLAVDLHVDRLGGEE